jgi:uncharacterized protein YndB with AHSA1/START domain
VSHVVTEIDIARSVDEVFAFVTDPRNDPLWWRGVREVRVLAGSEYEQVTRLFGRSFVARVKLSECEPPARAVLTAVQSATPFTATYTFESTDSGGTRFRMTATVQIVGWYKAFGPLFLPLLRWQTRRYFGVLKDVLESQTAYSPD